MGKKAHATDRFYTVLVTRDCTESAHIPVRARDEKAAGLQALVEANNFSHLFESNDNGGNLSAPYLGDDENDIEEITELDYKKLADEAQVKRGFDAENDSPACHPLFDEFHQFLRGEIQSGRIDAEGMAERLVRYALSPPDRMVQELEERMRLGRDSSGLG